MEIGKINIIENDEKSIIDIIPLDILRIIWNYDRLNYLIKPGLSSTSKTIYKSILNFLTVDDVAAMLLYRASYKKVENKNQFLEQHWSLKNVLNFDIIFDINDLWRQLRLFLSDQLYIIILSISYDEFLKINGNTYRLSEEYLKSKSNSHSLIIIRTIINGRPSIMLESWNFGNCNSKELEKIGRMFIELSNIFLKIFGFTRRYSVVTVDNNDEYSSDEENSDEQYDHIIGIYLRSYDEKTSHRSHFHELAELLLNKLRS